MGSASQVTHHSSSPNTTRHGERGVGAASVAGLAHCPVPQGNLHQPTWLGAPVHSATGWQLQPKGDSVSFLEAALPLPPCPTRDSQALGPEGLVVALCVLSRLLLLAQSRAVVGRQGGGLQDELDTISEAVLGLQVLRSPEKRRRCGGPAALGCRIGPGAVLLRDPPVSHLHW